MLVFLTESNQLIMEAKGSGYDDEHATVNMWNHAVHNPHLLQSKAHLHAEVEHARKDRNHPLNFHNQNDGFTGGKQPHHEEAYYNELKHASNTVHDIASHPAFKDTVKNKHHASVQGATRASVSSTWTKHNAKNATSKADIAIGAHTVSLKKGDSQLMSAGGEETKAVYDHAMRGMVTHNHASEADHVDVMSKMDQLHKHLSAMKDTQDDDEKRKHRDAGQAIVNDIHARHPKLSRYVNYEAATGHGKFGTHQTGTARFLVTSTNHGSTHIHDTAEDDIGKASELPTPRVALPKGSGRPGNVKLDYRIKTHEAKALAKDIKENRK